MKKLNFIKGLITLMILSFAFIVSNSGCKKNNNNTNGEKTFADLIVSQDFRFENSKGIQAEFKIIPAAPDELSHVFKIYQGNPAAGGRLLTKGIANENRHYSVAFSLPDRVNKIWVQNSNAEGIFEIIQLTVSGNTISHTFVTNDLLCLQNTEEKSVIVDPGCGSDCDELISGTYTDLTLDNLNYCVAEGTSLTVTGQLKFKHHATIVICGNANINNFQSADNKLGKVYISETGTLATSGHLNINSKIDIYNFGNYSISGNVNTMHPYKFYNYGTLNISGGINNKTKQFINEGTINLSGNYNGDENSKAYNYGTFTISGNMNINSNSFFYNYCSLNITGNLIINRKLYNYSYIKVGSTLTVNSSSYCYLKNASLIVTKNLTVNGDILGLGDTYSKIDIEENTTINSGGKVKSKIDLCDANGIEINNGTIQNSVVFCEITIPQSACNPGSSGSTGTDDTDGDGVPDVEDEYPEDPERAFNNYYPNQTDFGTFVFEDLWPGMGDYDFNDLVLDFQYKIVTNANNLIVDIIAKTHVKAAGASFDNGFGISFPVNPEKCGSVSGYVHALNDLNINEKGYENGHDNNTVAIFYDAINTIYNSIMFNTVPGGNVVETDTITVTTYFSDPQIEMGQEPYNPFIYVDQVRGKEIHLIDNPPTDLANMAYFNTEQDNSNPATGRWYVTVNNLPWVVEIPVSFNYPIEKVDILAAYLKFEAWAVSSGVSYTDWYLDEPGYRNEENIYVFE